MTTVLDMKRPLISRIPRLFAFSVIIFISLSNIDLALKKPFWVDEGYEIVVSCAMAPSAMFRDGMAPQCSPNPLYYWVQKVVVESLFLGRFDVEILWKYRVLSLISAAFFLALIYLFFSRAFNELVGLVALFGISSAAIFHNYSAENRPYSLWLLLFVTTLISAFRISRPGTPDGRSRTRNRILVIVSALALVLVSGAGGVQGLAILFGIFIIRPKEIHWLFPSAVLIAVVAWYYGRHSCISTDAGQYDLLVTRNWELLRSVAELFWLSPFHLLGLSSDTLVLIGLFFPFSKRGLTAAGMVDEKTRTWLRTIHIHLWLQLGASVALGGLVAYRHYFFVERIFIFLIVLKAIAMALGAAIAWRAILQFKIAARLRSVSTELVLAGAVAAFCLISAHNRKGAILYNVPKPIVFENVSSTPCLSLPANWRGYISKAATPDIWLNSIVAFSQLVRSCASAGNQTVLGDRAVVFKPTGGTSQTSATFEFVETAPDDSFKPISQCGKTFPIR